MGRELKLDSVAANVADVDAALDGLHAATGLAPFLRFELVDGDRTFPVALVMVGTVSLEFVGRVEPGDGAGAARISSLNLEVPGAAPAELDLEESCRMVVRPGGRKRVTAVTVETPTPEADAGLLASACGAELVRGEGLVRLQGVEIRFADGRRQPEARAADGEYFVGWHRLGLACNDLQATVAHFESLGFETMLAAYRVLPGIEEAMMQLPSGLVLQPVRQVLWRMLPAIGWHKFIARLRGRPIRFHVAALFQG